MIRGMGEVTNDILMEIFTKESFNMEKRMVKEDMNGCPLEKFMMANGLKG